MAMSLRSDAATGNVSRPTVVSRNGGTSFDNKKDDYDYDNDDVTKDKLISEKYLYKDKS